MKMDEFWNDYLVHSGIDKTTKYLDAFHFELTEHWANELLRLVMIGQKKATSSSIYEYELNQEELPKVGSYHIVTDWDGNPKCVIQTTNVRILPFKDITFDICKLEGEDDCLESWQKGHRKFFTEDGKETGYEFTEDMPVVFEEFEVVYQ